MLKCAWKIKFVDCKFAHQNSPDIIWRIIITEWFLIPANDKDSQDNWLELRYVYMYLPINWRGSSVG